MALQQPNQIGSQTGGQRQPQSQQGFGTQGQPPQQGIGGQQGFGQQQQQQFPQQGQQRQQMEGTLDQALSSEMQQGLQLFFEAAKACEWCAERCVGEGPQMAECLRLCRDVADLASLNARFVARDSVFGPELAQLFITTAQECAQECAQHSHQHCQECARVLGQAIETTQNMLQSFQSMSGGGQQQGMQTQTMGSQPAQSMQSSQGMQSSGMQSTGVQPQNTQQF
jgi:hypothetical protein